MNTDCSYRGTAIKNTVDKLETLDEFRANEMMKVIYKQYDNVCLESLNKLKVNSVVLLRNITNDIKREPLKLARIEEIKKSRDDAQRVVVVTYHNISLNKKGEWIGTPVTVERCVNDLVLVDDALDESMLNPEQQNMNMRTNTDDQASGNNKIIASETQEVQEISDDKKKTETSKADVKVD